MEVRLPTSGACRPSLQSPGPTVSGPSDVQNAHSAGNIRHRSASADPGLGVIDLGWLPHAFAVLSGSFRWLC